MRRLPTSGCVLLLVLIGMFQSISARNLELVRQTCGNDVVEGDEDCDCGSIADCHMMDPCCDPITCKLTDETQCSLGPCCDTCRFQKKGEVCREAANECDLPEQCSGETVACPPDMFKKNGTPCGKNTGHCFNGFCPTLELQCEQIWGYGGTAGDSHCLELFNSKGSINGHCGSDTSGKFLKCSPENVKCGSLQCQLGYQYPAIKSLNDTHDYSRRIISVKGHEFECKTITKRENKLDPKYSNLHLPHMGLARDGTPCGENLICLNQTCTSIFPYITQEKCPSNHESSECSGHGDCTNQITCVCKSGWTGTDCSIQVEVNTPSSQTAATSGLVRYMRRTETPYEDSAPRRSNTKSLVVTLMSVTGGVFVVFTAIALYYSWKGSQRVRTSNHMGSGGPSHFQEYKMQQLKRMGVDSAGEDDQGHSGTSSIVGLPPVSKVLTSDGVDAS